jgi:hypothetical protein
MRTRYFSLSLLIFMALTLIIACSPAESVALLPPRATVMSGWQYVATATPPAGSGSASVYQSDSGLYLTARVVAPCMGVAWSTSACSEPYAGEFVVTTYNGAEVARVMTNWSGQGLVSLPPGRYIVGVRTASYYPQAAPVAVSVYADSYASAWFNLTAGPRQAVTR